LRGNYYSARFAIPGITSMRNQRATPFKLMPINTVNSDERKTEKKNYNNDLIHLHLHQKYRRQNKREVPFPSSPQTHLNQTELILIYSHSTGTSNCLIHWALHFISRKAQKTQNMDEFWKQKKCISSISNKLKKHK
jgi:hypothetical protein